jgi:L-ectoine synthase
MKIIRINQLDPVQFTGGLSFRAILEKDNMGFAMMKTVVPRGGPHHWHYKNHLEACYCIKGKGELTNLETGLKVLIVPDMVYVLDKHDDHTFEALEDCVLISIFNPPLTGNESHDENGIYESTNAIEVYNKSRDIVQKVRSFKNDWDAAEYVSELITNKTLSNV